MHALNRARAGFRSGGTDRAREVPRLTVGGLRPGLGAYGVGVGLAEAEAFAEADADAEAEADADAEADGLGVAVGLGVGVGLALASGAVGAVGQLPKAKGTSVGVAPTAGVCQGV